MSTPFNISAMQIESLGRLNAKYDPTWVPRYLIVDGYRHRHLVMN
jgi:lysylphosphatidylglycerol synthetase-like protein (DUF2156 family)